MPATRFRRRPSPTFWLFALVVLAAFALRAYGLEIQSLWNDEGNSIGMARRGFLAIAQHTARDIHPPLYYWTLHAWVQGAGFSVAALRLLSAFYGTLTVAVVMRLARDWFGDRAALVAGVAAAVSPFAIHYAQEVRMYALVTLLGALSWWAFGAWLNRPTPRRLALWWLAALAVAYTHYFGVALIATQNLVWALLWWRERRTRQALAWLTAQAGLALCYLPWLWYSRTTLLNWPAISEAFGVGFLVRELVRVFSLGESVPPTWSPWLWGFLALAGLGLWGAWRVGRWGWCALAWWLTPPALMVLLSALDRPFYNPKFLLQATPGFHLVLGLGVQTLTQRLPRSARWGLTALASVFLVAAAVAPLRNEWRNPRYWRDEYRGIARTIEATASPDDAILLLGGGQIEVFDYYYQGDLPRYPITSANVRDEARLLATLETLARTHRRLYAILWGQQQQDPQGIVEQWLNEHAFKASDRWYGDVRLVVYEFGDLSDQLRPVDAVFGDVLRLEQAAVAPLSVPSGDIVRLELEWSALTPPERAYTFFAQVLDGGTHIVGQRDAPPAAQPTSAWRLGERYRGRVGVPIFPGTPPGTYRLIVGVYDAATGARLPLPDGADALILAAVQVERPAVPPDPDALDRRVEAHERLGDLTLMGWRFNKLGFDHAPETPLHAGEPMQVVLFWRAERDAPHAPAFTLRLLDADGREVGAWGWTPTEGRFPLDAWRQGDVVRDPQVVFVPGVPPGAYTLVLDADGERVVLGRVVLE